MDLSYISIAALAVTITIQTTVSELDTKNLKFDQFPEGPMLLSDGSRAKVTYRVSLNNTGFQSFKLIVTLGESRIPRSGVYDNVTVIYNGCTDSNTPDWLCKEAQITLSGTQNFKQISLDLYKRTNNIHVVKVHNLTRTRIVQIAKPIIPTDLITTITEPKSSNSTLPNVDLITTITKPKSSNSTLDNVGVPQVTYLLLGLMAGLVVSVLLNIMLLSVTVCCCIYLSINSCSKKEETP